MNNIATLGKDFFHTNELYVSIRARVREGELQILAFGFSIQVSDNNCYTIDNIRMKLNDCA